VDDPVVSTLEVDVADCSGDSAWFFAPLVQKKKTMLTSAIAIMAKPITIKIEPFLFSMDIF
jgi:hypothetical protein